MPTSKQIEQLQLTARLAAVMCLNNQVDSGSADMCNLHELALAGLGYHDTHPQVPLDEIERYVKDQLGTRLLPVSEEE